MQLLFIMGAPTGVIARARRGDDCVVLLPSLSDEAVHDLAALILDQQEFAEFQRYVRACGVQLSPDARPPSGSAMTDFEDEFEDELEPVENSQGIDARTHEK